jgi:tetratricopeptide (TPR) repeat protein
VLTFKESLRPVGIVLLAFLAYWICLRFGFPGYFSPLAAHHPDLYIPVAMSEVPWLGLFAYPRPLSFVMLRFFGLFGLAGSILASILPSIALAIAAVFFVQRWSQTKLAWISIVSYFTILFCQGDFYFEHRHDPHVSLTCILLLIATEYWRKWLLSSRLADLLISLVVIVVLELLKETYSVSLAVLFLGMVILEDKLQIRRLLVPLLAVAATGLLSLALSFRQVWMSGAPMFGTRKLLTAAEAAAAPYRVSLAPTDLIKSFGFYTSHGINRAGYVLLAVAIISVLKNRRPLRLAVMLLLAGFAALVPNSVLPNHLFEEYSWDCVPLLFAPVLLVPGTWIGSLAIGAATCIWLFTTLRVAHRSPSLLWQVEQEQQNQRIMEAFPTLRKMDSNGKHVLIAGLTTPYHPWVYATFAEHELGRRRWTIIVPEEKPETHEPSAPRYVHATNVDLNHFDYAICFDGKGNLTKLLDHEALGKTSIADIVSPDLRALEKQLASKPNDLEMLIKVGRAYLYWGLFDQANVYFERAVTAGEGKNPYPYFYLGQSYEGKGDYLAARTAYEQAVKVVQDPRDPVFQTELDRLRRSSKFNPDGTLATPTAAAQPPVSFSADPNPVNVVDGSQLGITSLAWKTPATEYAEIHVDKPNGALLCRGTSSGNCATGKWVKDGTTFYLQDSTAADPEDTEATLSTVVVHVQPKGRI